MRRAIPVFIWVVVVVGASRACAQPSFQGLGDLPGGAFESRAFGVSADGTVVVGSSKSGVNDEAFRWTRQGGIVGIGDLPGGGFQSVASAVSADGNSIVGWGGGTSGIEAFRWRQATGFEALGRIGGISQALGVSSDGSVIAGRAMPPSGFQAFRWTAGTGMTGLGWLGGPVPGSTAWGVSADGFTIVGHSTNSINRVEAFRWTSATGMVGLGDFPTGDFWSEAHAVSPDGSVIVGLGQPGFGQRREAFRWDEASGMIPLGDLSNGMFGSSALALSADGEFVVGRSQLSFAAGNSIAFLWNAGIGMRDLRALLVDDFGLAGSLAGWTLVEARGISANGNVIVGYGINPSGQTEGWVAVVPEPGTALLILFGPVAMRACWAGSVAEPRHTHYTEGVCV